MFNTERRKKVKIFYDILDLKTKIDEICLQSVKIIGSKGSPYSEQRYSAISQMDDIITSKPIMVAVVLQNMAIDSKNVPKIAEISLTSSNEELFLTDQLLRLIPQREVCACDSDFVACSVHVLCTLNSLAMDAGKRFGVCLCGGFQICNQCVVRRIPVNKKNWWRHISTDWRKAINKRDFVYLLTSVLFAVVARSHMLLHTCDSLRKKTTS